MPDAHNCCDFGNSGKKYINSNGRNYGNSEKKKKKKKKKKRKLNVT